MEIEILSSLNNSNTKIEILNTTVNNRIKYLEDELANAQADKEFVWSLWRQLQANNPDVTNAISSVIQREKEKNELRDTKILEILKIKDDKIKSLLESINLKESECKNLKEKLKETEIQLIKRNEEVNFFEMNAKTLNDKEQMYEQMLRAKEDKNEKALRESESEKQHLVSKLRDLVKEIAESNEKESNLKIENDRQKDTIEILNTQIKQANLNYEKLMKELNDFRTAIDNNLKADNERLTNELKAKNLLNDKIRNELNELWSKFNAAADYSNQQENIIKQLKENQNNLHSTIKKQQETFQNENDSLKKMYDQISHKYEQILQSEKQIISETYLNQQQLQHQQAMHLKQIKLAEKSTHDTVKAFQYEIDQLKLKINLQVQQLNDKQLICDDLKNKLDEYELLNIQEKSRSKNFVEINKTLNRSKSVCQLKSALKSNQSKSCRTGPLKKVTLSEGEINDSDKNESDNEENCNLGSIKKIKSFYENVCKAKDKQIETIKLAHQRRLERLISLEKEHKMLKNYVKSFVEEDDIENIFKDNKKYKQAAAVALNDSEELTNPFQNRGYVRKENGENVLNELKLARHDNRRLMHENLDLKEKIDLLNVKYVEENEKVQSLNLELNVKIDEKDLKYKAILVETENELKSSKQKVISCEDEIAKLKQKIADLDVKCANLLDERIKFTDLSAKLSEENKKLYKKWYLIRKNETKFRNLLIEQMNKRSQAKIRRKICRKSTNDKLSNKYYAKESTNEEDFEILKIESFSSASLTSSEDETKKQNTKKSLNPLMKQKTVLLFRKKFDELNKRNLSLETKIDQLNIENQKLNKEINNFEVKFKQVKTQNEHYSIEINSLKRKEADSKEREEKFKKQEEQLKDEIKRNLETKLKQTSADLTKQINLTRTLRSENEKLNDKLKVNEEKLNHTDRDNVQKKQLIEFYKKKLEEFNQKEKNEICSSDKDYLNEPIIDLKAQVKKLTESAEKSKTEMKSLKERLKCIQTEKLMYENKCVEFEKSLNCEFLKYEAIKKEKSKSDLNFKNSKKKINDIEAYVKELETSAESNIRSLSLTSQETIAIAQYRLKYAFKSVDDYERIFAYLYETLINRCIDLKKEIIKEKKNTSKLNNKRQVKQNSHMDVVQSMDDNMKKAMDLASSVLNLTSNELEDILLSSNSIENDSSFNNKDTNKDDNELVSYKKQCKKMLAEFNDCICLNKKELMKSEMNFVYDENFNKNICDLVSQRLNELLQYERELASIHAYKNI